MSKNILFVDDEKAILKSIKRIFVESDYTIFTAESGVEALTILAEENMDIVISDMRMPGMDGYQLLKEVRQLYPETTRIILSGYSEEKEIFKAILDGSSKMYIFKPWDNEILHTMIRQILDFREMLKNKKLLTVINKMEGLVTLADMYNSLSLLIEKNADIKEIADMVEKDPVIAARVLHIANSSFFGAKTGSIKQAIVFLGLTAVKNIVLTTSVFESAKGKFVTGFNKELLWKHAGLTNKLTLIIYKELLGKKIPDIASTAGLLHDIGRVVLLKQFNLEYIKILEELQCRPERSFREVEEEVLGISHQEVGGYLLDWWGLPQKIVEAALFHHDPLNENVVDKELVSVVHLADYYACKILNYKIQRKPDERVFVFLHITQESCEKVLIENKTI